MEEKAALVVEDHSEHYKRYVAPLSGMGLRVGRSEGSELIDTVELIQWPSFGYNVRKRKNRVIEQNKCYHLVSRLGPKNISDGLTPAEVVLTHPDGEPVHFVFKDGESIARPDPGVHIKMDLRHFLRQSYQ